MLNQVASRIAGKIRGEGFRLDPEIPVGYLLGFAAGKLVARVRGMIALRRLSPAAFVGAGAVVKCPSKIRANGFVNFHRDSYVDALSTEGIRLGSGFSLGRGASIECTGSLRSLGKGFVAGDNVGVGSDSFIGCAGGVEIGSDTILGNLVTIHSENHIARDPLVPVRLQGVDRKGIRIGANCWIGAKVTILDGVVLGDNSIVAAGAVVRAGEYAPWSLLAGVPARVVRSLR